MVANNCLTLAMLHSTDSCGSEPTGLKAVGALAVAAAATKAIAQPAEGWKHYTEDELQVLDNICAAAP